MFLTSMLNTREILNYHGNKYERICLLKYDVVNHRSYIYIYIYIYIYLFICVCCLLHIRPDYKDLLHRNSLQYMWGYKFVPTTNLPHYHSKYSCE